MRLFKRTECIAIIRKKLKLPYDEEEFKMASACAQIAGRPSIHWPEFAVVHLAQFGIRRNNRGARGWSFEEVLEVLEKGA